VETGGRELQLVLRSLRGITRRGQPVILDEDHRLQCQIPGDCFDVFVHVQDEGDLQFGISSPPEEMNNPPARRLQAGAVDVTHLEAMITVPASSLYLGRYKLQDRNVMLVKFPWVTTFSALTPKPQEEFAPMVDTLQEIIGSLPSSSGNALNVVRFSMLFQLALTWHEMPLSALALQCHVSNQCLHSRLGIEIVSATSPFDLHSFLERFSDRPPLPADFAALLKDGWIPPTPGFRELKRDEYTANPDASAQSIHIDITTFMNAELEIRLWQKLVHESKVEVPKRLTVEWQQGKDQVDLDAKSLSVIIPLAISPGADKDVNRVSLRKLPSSWTTKEFADGLTLYVPDEV
jgi:hypothetical protein